MADPLSILASIAGVATAGVAITNGLWEIANTLKNAPSEVSQMARELSMLSSILRNLKTTMDANRKILKQKLIQDTHDLLAKIRAIYQEVKDIIRDRSRSQYLYSLKLLFKSAKTRKILAKIEAFKSTLNVVLTTIQLASLQVHLNQSKDLATSGEVTGIRRLLEALLLSSNDSISKMSKADDVEESPQRFSRHSNLRRSRWSSHRSDRKAPTPPPNKHGYGTKDQPPTARPGGLNTHPASPPLKPNATSSKFVQVLGAQYLEDTEGDKENGDGAPSENPSADGQASSHPISDPSGPSNKKENNRRQMIGDRHRHIRKALSSTGKSGRSSSTSSGSHTSDSDFDEDVSDFDVTTEAHYGDYPAASGKKVRYDETRENPTQSMALVRRSTSASASKARPATVESEEETSHAGVEAREPSLENKATSRDEPANIFDAYYAVADEGPPLTHQSRESTSSRKWYGTNVPVLRGENPPDDTATWLYRLVFMDELPPLSSRFRTSPVKEETPNVVARLLLEWTKMDPITINTPRSDSHSSKLPAPGDGDDQEWMADIKKLISEPWSDLFSDEDDYELERPGGRRPQHSEYTSTSGTNSRRYEREEARRPYSGSTSYPRPSMYPDPLRRTYSPSPTFGPRCRESDTYRNPFVAYPEARQGEHNRYNGYMPTRPAHANPGVEPISAAYQAGKEDANAEYMRGYHRPWQSRDSFEMAPSMDLETEKKLQAHDEMLKTFKFESEKTQKRLAEMEAKERAAKDAEAALKQAEEERRRERDIVRVLENAEKEAADRTKTEIIDEAKRRQVELETDLALAAKTLYLPRMPSEFLSHARFQERALELVTPRDDCKKAAVIGNVCWAGPSLANASEMYQALVHREWKPLWMRGSAKGETWFLGDKAFLVHFFCKEYATHADFKASVDKGSQGGDVWWETSQDDYAAVPIGLIEEEAIAQLSLPYKGLVGSQHRFDVTITNTDIEDLVATSMLIRERRLRKECRLPKPLPASIPQRSTAAPVPDTAKPTPRLTKSKLQSTLRSDSALGSSAASDSPQQVSERKSHRRRKHRTYDRDDESPGRDSFDRNRERRRHLRREPDIASR